MALGLDGWVANTSEGAVRCVAEGPRETLETLLGRLEAGPARPSWSGSASPGCRRPARSGRSGSGVGATWATDVWAHRTRETGRVGYSVSTDARPPSCPTMEPNSASEDLPRLYRAVLDRVAEIAASGRRPLANDVRATGDPHLLASLGRPRATRARGTSPAPFASEPGRGAARDAAAPPTRPRGLTGRPSELGRASTGSTPGHRGVVGCVGVR